MLIPQNVRLLSCLAEDCLVYFICSTEFKGPREVFYIIQNNIDTEFLKIEFI